jgi:hypothetical protein
MFACAAAHTLSCTQAASEAEERQEATQRKHARVAAQQAQPAPGGEPTAAHDAPPSADDASDVMDATQPFVAADAAQAPEPSHALVLPPPLSAGAADVASFLRGITPRLSCVDAVIASLRNSSGVSMARLDAIASAPYASPERFQRALDYATAKLGVSAVGDQMLFVSALLCRARAPALARAA